MVTAAARQRQGTAPLEIDNPSRPDLARAPSFSVSFALFRLPRPAATTMPTPIRVLLADPEDPGTEPLGASLRRRGLDVVRVRDHASFTDAVATERFDVVVLDVRVTGPRTAGTLRALRDVDASTPVLLLALGSELARMADVLKPGRADFLLRPCQAETLIAAIQDASERESAPCLAVR